MISAELFLELEKIRQKDFFANLKRIDNGRLIPNISIDGASIERPGFYLKKINPMDELEAAHSLYLAELFNFSASTNDSQEESSTNDSSDSQEEAHWKR